MSSEVVALEIPTRVDALVKAETSSGVADVARKAEGAQQLAVQGAARTGQDVNKRDASKLDATKQDAAKQEAAKQEAAKQEAARQEAAKQEAAKQEASKQDGSKQGETKALRGAFIVEVEDDAGHAVRKGDEGPFDPWSDRARMLAFAIAHDGQQPPSADQLALRLKIEQLLDAARTVFAPADPRFRLHFVSLYGAAKWGLEGEQVASAEAIKTEVERIEQELIGDAAGAVKNAYLGKLATAAAGLAVPFLAVYMILRLSPSRSLAMHLSELQIVPSVMSNYMLLWIGCFVGVCLSYALRTAEPKLADLTTPAKDYLRPAVRLVFAGTLTMLLALFASIGFVDLQVGTLKLSDITTNASLAFIIGTICGISELALPDTVGKRATGLVASAK